MKTKEHDYIKTITNAPYNRTRLVIMITYQSTSKTKSNTYNKTQRGEQGTNTKPMNNNNNNEQKQKEIRTHQNKNQDKEQKQDHEQTIENN